MMKIARMHTAALQCCILYVFALTILVNEVNFVVRAERVLRIKQSILYCRNSASAHHIVAIFIVGFYLLEI